MENNRVICVHCGAPADEGVVYCRNCGKAVAEEPPQAAAPIHTAAYTKPNTEDELEIDMPMKWFKFLIYFALFASAVLNVFSGFRYISGNQNAAYYERIDGLEGLDTFMSWSAIAMGALALIARFRLAGFYKNGPKLLKLMYGMNVLISCIYFLGLKALATHSGYQVNITSLIPSIAAGVFMYAVNSLYFSKREHLFRW